MKNALSAKIRNHPSYQENVHAALIEVIESECSPEQLSIMQDDPVVLQSLIGGMLAAMLDSPVADENETACHEHRLRQAEGLLRKSWAAMRRSY